MELPAIEANSIGHGSSLTTGERSSTCQPQQSRGILKPSVSRLAVSNPSTCNSVSAVLPKRVRTCCRHSSRPGTIPVNSLKILPFCLSLSPGFRTSINPSRTSGILAESGLGSPSIGLPVCATVGERHNREASPRPLAREKRKVHRTYIFAPDTGRCPLGCFDTATANPIPSETLTLLIASQPSANAHLGKDRFPLSQG